MDTDVRRAVAANAVFSLATGVILAVDPASVGGWLGVDIDGWLRLLGLVLIGHAVALWWVRQRHDLDRWAQLNLLAIAPYPLLMIALAFSGVIESGLGTILVLLDGLIVGALAWSQWRGLRTSDDKRGAYRVVSD